MATNSSTKRKRQQRQAIFRILLLLGILACVNMIAARIHYGFDLTEEKRFTLSPSTKKLLRKMNDVAVIDVYLKGKFPAGFQRLAEATREKLQNFREIGGKNIVFRFSDPFEGRSEAEKGPIFDQMAKKGINGVNLQVQGGADDGYSEKIIFPYALVSYRGREIPVQLLDNNHPGMSPMEVLNYSESILEYKFASALNVLSQPDKPKIAYITGHGENLGPTTSDMLNTLRFLYHLDTLDLSTTIKIKGPGLGLYEAIIINKPKETFSDKDKFKIDQYIMRGGHVLWLIDPLNASMDSLNNSNAQMFMTQDLNLNLDDMLFKYGVRVNPNLIEDMTCNPIAVVVGMLGDKPQQQLRNWLFFPVLVPESKHPIVHNLDAVMTVFASSLDTIANPDIRKTVLLASSKYSRTVPNPARVSLSMLSFQPRSDMFNDPNKPVAVLLEGKFKSVFNNRLQPEFLSILKDSLHMPFLKECDTPTSMIVIGDGDMFENDYSQTKGTMEMGYWRFTDTRFANKIFMLNCMEYLTDKSGLLESRSKDVKLRLLDGSRIKKERKTWQLVNIAIPIGVILIFASCYIFFRKRRYEK
jgi:gliding-associated putative ABC transporter substrate-binding component GldG